MNFKNLALTILICIGLLSCKAQKRDYDSSVLWEITKPGNSHILYILGTIHILDTTQINFPIKKIKVLIDGCKNLCLEVVPGQADDYRKMNRYLYLRNNDLKIVNCLDKEHYDELYQIADSSKYLLKRFKPYLDSIRPTVLSFYLDADRQLMQTEKIKTLNYRPERDFLQYAQRKGYELIPLETSQQQTDWILRLDQPYEKSLEQLKKSINSFYDKGTHIDIFKKYSEQNLALFQPEEFSDSIMILRNYRMAEKIDSLMNIESLFVAIGAGHLPYKNGVLNLLAQKGYNVKPYKINFKK